MASRTNTALPTKKRSLSMGSCTPPTKSSITLAGLPSEITPSLNWLFLNKYRSYEHNFLHDDSTIQKCDNP